MPASIRASTGRASGRAVAVDVALEAEPVACRHHRDAVAAEVAADSSTASPGRTSRVRSGAALDSADAGRGDEQLVGLAALHHLGVAGHELRRRPPQPPSASRRRRAERRHRQTLLEDEAGAEVERSGAAHRQIVDGAVDRERCRCRRPGRTAAGRRRQSVVKASAARSRSSAGAVVRGDLSAGLRRQAGTVFEQTRHRPPAAAMGELDRCRAMARARGR